MNDFHAFCKAQIKRFAGRLGWTDPKENPEPARDLMEALERGSRGNSEIAKAIVNTCVEASNYCPTVPDILRVAQELRDKVATGPKFGFVGCQVCDYSGWIHVERNGYDFSEACVCRATPAKGTARPPDGGRASNSAKMSAASSAIDSRMRRAAGDDTGRL